MADEDEDLSHLRAPDAADVDPTEETQDYRALEHLDPASLSLPKRGEKDFESHSTQLQLSTLEGSRAAMHRVLSWQRTHTPKQHIVAMYHAASNMAYVQKVKSSHFLTMGRSLGGKEWLLPEEALFMIERGSMDCRWPVDEGDEMQSGAPMSLQGAYAAFLGFEAGVGGKLTLEMYTVYAGLKRAGYVVFRHGSWDDDGAALQPLSEAALNADAPPKSGLWTRFFAAIWRSISQNPPAISPADMACGPWVKPGLYRSYADIYRLIQKIPTHDHSQPPAFILPAITSPANPFRLHFDVWKTSGSSKFRKTNRPPPDFRVCVVNARESSIPTGAQLNDLLATVPDDGPKGNEQMYQKLKQGKRNVVLAVVDNGIPSYIRVADAPFSGERVYERQAKAPRGKGGGRGGRGGGRGRGRGRGR